MLMTIEEARNCLRVEHSEDDAAITNMVQAVEDFIITATGMTRERMEAEPMAKTTAWHMLRQWYDMDDTHIGTSGQRVIDSMLKTLTLLARESGE